MNLDFIVAHNDPMGAVGFSVQSFTPGLFERLGITATTHSILEMKFREKRMHTGAPFPENALIYVHGNMAGKMKNVGTIRELVAERPDLRMILAIEGEYLSPEHFEREEDYKFAVNAHGMGFDAENPVVVSEEMPSTFLYGKEGDRPINNSFERYLRQLKDLREPPRFQQQKPLDIVVLNDKDPQGNDAKDHISIALDSWKVQYRIHIEREQRIYDKAMADGSPFPQDAVVLLHGNTMARYGNIGRARELAVERPDLRFVVFVDEKYLNADYFSDEQDYDFVMANLRAGWNPQAQITIFTKGYTPFLTGVDFLGSQRTKIDDCLRNYVRAILPEVSP